MSSVDPRIEHLEKRVDALYDRMNAAEKGDFSGSPYTKELLEGYKERNKQLQTLWDERTEKSGAQKFMESWKGKLTWVIGVAGGSLAIIRFFIIDPPF